MNLTNLINSNNVNNCNSCNMEEFVMCTENYLNSIREGVNIEKGDTIEFYIDGMFYCDVKIQDKKDVISQCLSFYRNLCCEILCVNNHELKYTNLKENLKTQVFNSPRGILHINSIFDLNFSKNCIDIYVYDKEKNKNEILEYVKNNNLNEAQKEYIMNSFNKNDAYNNDLSSILDDIKKEVLDAINKSDLKNLISDMGYTIFDLINKDISEDIISLIDKNSEIYNVYRNLISVVKVEYGYLIMFCDDILYEIKYNIELCIE